MSANSISAKGIDFIKSYEDFKPKPYWATADEKARGIATIGYGMTKYPDGRKVRITDPAIDVSDANAMFAVLLRQFEDAIRPYIKRPATQGQWDAMTSLAFNIGTGDPKNQATGGFLNSTCLRKFNAGDLAGAADALTWFDKQNGKVLAGLVRRRAAEKVIFSGGAYVNN